MEEFFEILFEFLFDGLKWQVVLALSLIVIVFYIVIGAVS